MDVAGFFPYDYPNKQILFARLIDSKLKSVEYLDDIAVPEVWTIENNTFSRFNYLFASSPKIRSGSTFTLNNNIIEDIKSFDINKIKSDTNTKKCKEIWDKISKEITIILKKVNTVSFEENLVCLG